MFQNLQKHSPEAVAEESLLAEIEAAELVVGEDDLDLEDTVTALEDFDVELTDAEGFFDDVDRAAALTDAIENFGLTKGLIAFADFEGGLRASVSQIPLVENIAAEGYAPDSDESKVAIEGIIDTVKTAIAAFAKKAWDMITGFAGKVANLVKSAGAAVAGAVGWFGHKTWDAAKAAGSAVKAHPIATVLAVLAACAAVPVVLSACWGLALPTSAATFTTWGTAMATQLGKVAPFGNKWILKNGKKLARVGGKGMKNVGKQATKISAVGEKNVKLVAEKASGIWGKASGFLAKLPGMIKTWGGKAIAFVKSIATEGWKAVGVAGSAVWALLRATWTTIAECFGSGAKLVRGWLAGMRNGFKGPNPTAGITRAAA